MNTSSRTLGAVPLFRVQLTEDMVDIVNGVQNPRAPKKGDWGSAMSVDDMGTIHMSWDKGGSLGLIRDVDHFVSYEDVSAEINGTGNDGMAVSGTCRVNLTTREVYDINTGDETFAPLGVYKVLIGNIEYCVYPKSSDRPNGSLWY